MWGSERAVTHPALAPWLKATTSGGEISRVTPAAQTAFQGGLRNIYLFTFPVVSNACSLITIFYVAVFKAILVKVSILLVAIYKHDKEQCEIFTGDQFFTINSRGEEGD
jgi:hypothetical protein